MRRHRARCRAAGIAVAASVFIAVPAAAMDKISGSFDDPDTAQRVETYLDSDQQRRFVERQWRDYGDELCGEASVPADLERLRLKYDRDRFTMGQHAPFPAAGDWSERWAGTACGHRQIVNIQFVAFDGDIAPIAVCTLNGFTESNFGQPPGVAAAATVAAAQIEAALGERAEQYNLICLDHGQVVDTTAPLGGPQSVLAELQTDPESTTFFENWTVRICGCETVIQMAIWEPEGDTAASSLDPEAVLPRYPNGDVRYADPELSPLVVGRRNVVYIDLGGGLIEILYFAFATAVMPEQPVVRPALFDQVIPDPTPDRATLELHPTDTQPFKPRLADCPLL